MSGSEVGNYNYEAYGAVRTQSGNQLSEFQFAGQQADSETGLTYMRGRYYDSSLGIFLSRDSIESLVSGPYSYARNNPVIYIDPTGHLSIASLIQGTVNYSGAALKVLEPVAAVVGIVALVSTAPVWGVGAAVLGGVVLATALVHANAADIGASLGVISQNEQSEADNDTMMTGFSAMIGFLGPVDDFGTGFLTEHASNVISAVQNTESLIETGLGLIFPSNSKSAGNPVMACYNSSANMCNDNVGISGGGVSQTLMALIRLSIRQ